MGSGIFSIFYQSQKEALHLIFDGTYLIGLTERKYIEFQGDLWAIWEQRDQQSKGEGAFCRDLEMAEGQAVAKGALGMCQRGGVVAGGQCSFSYNRGHVTPLPPVLGMSPLPLGVGPPTPVSCDPMGGMPSTSALHAGATHTPWGPVWGCWGGGLSVCGTCPPGNTSVGQNPRVASTTGPTSQLVLGCGLLLSWYRHHPVWGGKPWAL